MSRENNEIVAIRFVYNRILEEHNYNPTPATSRMLFLMERIRSLKINYPEIHHEIILRELGQKYPKYISELIRIMTYIEHVDKMERAKLALIQSRRPRM